MTPPEEPPQPHPPASAPPPVADWTIRQSQQHVDGWIRSIGVRYFGELTNLAQLVEEVGEVARILSRTKGEQSNKAGESPGDLGDELADVMFVVICLANQSGVDLQAAFEKNLDKKSRRDATRHRDNPKLTEAQGDQPCRF